MCCHALKNITIGLFSNPKRFLNTFENLDPHLLSIIHPLPLVYEISCGPVHHFACYIFDPRIILWNYRHCSKSNLVFHLSPVSNSQQSHVDRLSVETQLATHTRLLVRPKPTPRARAGDELARVKAEVRQREVVPEAVLSLLASTSPTNKGFIRARETA